MGMAIRSEAIAVFGELQFKLGFDHLTNRLL